LITQKAKVRDTRKK